MPTFLQDLRYGLRTLARTPGFTLVASAVLALGIGVNTTVFTLANAFFLKPLPVPDPETLVRVYSNRFSNTRYRTYTELRDRNSTLEALAAFQLRSFGLRADRESEAIFGEIVSGNYFEVLRVRPAAGRLLGPADDRPGAPPAVVLTHAFWMRRFAGAPDAIGRIIVLNDQPFTIVGVTPKSFTGILAPLAGALWVPHASDALLRPAMNPVARLESESFHLAGRLKPGVELRRAQGDLDLIVRRVLGADGQPSPTPAVTVYGATMLHPEVSRPVAVFTTILMAVVGLVLLIACVNVANLVLARAAGRSAELAVRRSLGAGRGRLVRQLLTENLVLSAVGSLGGLAIAYWCTRFATSVQLPVPVPLALDLSVDARVLAFTILAAVAATLGFGLGPALTASSTDLVRALKGADAGGGRSGRMRSAFLVAQVSMSVLLLVIAGLAVRSVRNARSIDTGFDARDVLTASIDLDTRGYSPERGRDFMRSLVARLDAAPGIESSTVADIIPLTLSNTTTYLLRSGDPQPPQGQAPVTPQIYTNRVGPGHFRTLRIGLLSGRDFNHSDTETAQPVAIVNETFARRFWPGASAIGQRLRPIEGDARDIEVIGVVRDSKYVSIGEDPRPFLYRPIAQAYVPRLSVLVRGSGSTVSTLAIVRQELRALDPGLPLFNIEPLEEAISISLLPVRTAGALLGLLGALALALTALGVYGVLSFLVRSRIREIGIRVAVGAPPSSVAALVVKQSMFWTACGATLGLAAAFVLTPFLGSLFYGVSPTDPVTLVGVVVILACVAAVASLLPALRASRLDPLSALRQL